MLQPAPDTTDRALLDHFLRNGPQKVTEVSQFLGVTRTAVRQRLGRLMEAGLIERSVDRTSPQPSRGRPRHCYSLSAKGERLSGDNYADLVGALWREVRNIDDPTIRRGLLGRLANRLAESYAGRVDGETLSAKMHSLQELMREKHLPFDVDESGHAPVMTVLACPYPELAEQDRSVCTMERMMLSEALGESFRLSECRFDGGNCCSFEPSSIGTMGT